MLLTSGWYGLDDIWRRRADKLLDDERIEELHRQWKKSKEEKQSEEMQLSIF